MATTFNDPVIIESASATALTVKASAGADYGLQVDESTASAATGLKIKPAAAGAGLALSTLSSGTNENLTVDAKGSGTIALAGTSTGSVGIRTASPSETLHVNGSLRATTLGIGAAAGTGASQVFIGGAYSGVNGLNVNTDLTPGTNQSGNGVQITPIINKDNSGTHPFFASLSVIAPGIGAGSATLTTAATLRIAGDPAVGTNKYGFWNMGTSQFDGGIVVGPATGGNKGAGTINVSADLYKNNTAYNNPDYVFDQHFDGANESGYPGKLPLEQLEECLRTEHHLPGVSKEPMGIFARQDVLLEKLEEAYLYIIELTRRVERLEAEKVHG